MPSDRLRFHAKPPLRNARMVLGLSGWMDGGDVSTGTVGGLVRALGAAKLAQIEPEGFYIYNFPGSMEISALFRPHTEIDDGIIRRLDYPANTFYYDRRARLILFVGKEPNFAWEDYAECIFGVARTFETEWIYFVGSVAGIAPHTRQPRLFCSVSQEALKDQMRQWGVQFSDYEGPASLVTHLTARASERGLKMASLVAEIPAYVEGKNPICIESVTRRLAGILGLQISLDDLRARSDAFEKKLNEAVLRKPDLLELIHRLESDYDNEVFDTQMGDLKDWLKQRGIRLD